MQQFSVSQLILHPPNFLNNFAGSPSNGKSDFSLLVYSTTFFILVTRHTLPCSTDDVTWPWKVNIVTSNTFDADYLENG